MKRATLILVIALVVNSPAATGQDKVQYREKGGKGIQTTSGKIDAESIAGVKIGSRTISSGDIIDIQYEVPALIRLDYPKAVAAESKSPADAIKEYDALLKNPSLANARFVKRHFEFKIAQLTAARVEDGSEPVAKALDALMRFKKENPDSWQLVPLTRTLARLQLQKDPPDTDGARKAYDELAAMPGLPPEVKSECNFLVIDLFLQADKLPEARVRLASLPAGDPRVRIYEIGCSSGSVADAAKQLEDVIDKTSDRSLKASAYNMLGDCYRRDPKTKKEALYAHLWVDVVYNDDANEVSKAVSRLADLFAELKDEERARKYRERLKGK